MKIHTIQQNVTQFLHYLYAEFTKSSEGDFYEVDGVRLSESGMYQIRALTMEQQAQPRRRRHNARRHGSSADILATIESVIAGGHGYAGQGNLLAIQEDLCTYFS